MDLSISLWEYCNSIFQLLTEDDDSKQACDLHSLSSSDQVQEPGEGSFKFCRLPTIQEEHVSALDEDQIELAPLPSPGLLRRKGAVRHRGRGFGLHSRTFAFKTFRKPGDLRKCECEEESDEEEDSFSRRYSNAL